MKLNTQYKTLEHELSTRQISEDGPLVDFLSKLCRDYDYDGPELDMIRRMDLTAGVLFFARKGETPIALSGDSVFRRLARFARYLLASRLYKGMCASLAQEVNGALPIRLVQRELERLLDDPPYEMYSANKVRELHVSVTSLYRAHANSNPAEILESLCKLEDIFGENFQTIESADLCDVALLTLCASMLLDFVFWELDGSLPLAIRIQRESLSALDWPDMIRDNPITSRKPLELLFFKRYVDSETAMRESAIVLWYYLREFCDPTSTTIVGSDLQDILTEKDSEIFLGIHDQISDSKVSKCWHTLFSRSSPIQMGYDRLVLGNPEWLIWDSAINDILKEPPRIQSVVGFNIFLSLLLPVVLLDTVTASVHDVSLRNQHTYGDLLKLSQELGTISPNAIRRLNTVLHLNWPDHQEIPFVHACAILFEVQDSVLSVSLGEAAVFLRKLFGDNGEYYSQVVRRTPLVAYCLEIDRTSSSNWFGPLIHYAYHRSKLICADDMNPLRSRQSNEELTSNTNDVAKALTFDLPTKVTGGWKTWIDEYLTLRSSFEWDEENKDIGTHAYELCLQMNNVGRINLATCLEERWFGQVKKKLIARRVIIGMTKVCPDEKRRLYLMGWIEKEELAPGILPDRRRYSTYIQALGLPAAVARNPKKEGLLPEEIEWLEAFEP